MKIFGVDLGTYSVKVAEMDVTARGYVLSGFHEFALSLDPQKDKSLEVIEALRKLSAASDPSNTKWVLGVSQSNVSVHFNRFPFKERQKILKSLAFELEDEIPLDIDETIFDAGGGTLMNERSFPGRRYRLVRTQCARRSQRR